MVGIKKPSIIVLRELEPYLNFVRLERDLMVRLTNLKEEKLKELKDVKTLKNVAKQLQDLRRVHGFKFKFNDDKEMMKEIRRLAK